MTTPSDSYALLQRDIDHVLDRSARRVLQFMIAILIDKEPIPMADIQTALADLDTAVKGVADRSASDVADLQAQIDALKAQGVDTAQIQAIADSIEANVQKLNAIDPVADVPVPDAPATPADPTPAPAEPAPVDPDAPAQAG